MNKKLFNKGIISIPIILFSVIVILALAGGGYYWFQNQQNKIKTTAPTASPKAQFQQPSPQPVANAPQISQEEEEEIDDAQRISDIEAFKAAIALYLATTKEANPILCKNGIIYKSITGSTAVDGTGWLPINFEKTPGGSPLAKLYIDPLNDLGHYYGYACDPQTLTFELDANLESSNYKDLSSQDGGDNPNIYEAGTNLKIIH